MKKRRWKEFILIGIILLIIIILIGFPRAPECETDSDCPPITEKVCRNDSACLISTFFRCDNQSGQGRCVEAGGGIGCTNCSNGCLDGECILPGNQSDLIIKNISWISNTSNYYHDAIYNVTITIQNIGNLRAESSETRVTQDAVVLDILDTPALMQLEYAELRTIQVLVPHQSTISLTAKADYSNVVPESNENNNEETVSIPYSN